MDIMNADLIEVSPFDQCNDDNSSQLSVDQIINQIESNVSGEPISLIDKLTKVIKNSSDEV
jgi:hypothetical protein